MQGLAVPASSPPRAGERADRRKFVAPLEPPGTQDCDNSVKSDYFMTAHNLSIGFFDVQVVGY